MPELPEVEIHARNLRRWLEGRCVVRCAVLDPLLTGDTDPHQVEALLAGQRVSAVRRQAKYLLIDLEGGTTATVHLRMTGRFVRDEYVAGEPAKHTRLVLELDDGTRVRFEDRRRFGRIWLAETGALAEHPELAGIGPDALLEPMTVEQLQAIASRTKRGIKTVLMDQRLIGGIGNIYAAEILFRAGIAPDTPANRLTEAQLRDIVRITPEYLEWAIETQGRKELIYLGEKGAENVFAIYRRAGEPCPVCGAKIVRSVIGGRGTYYCSECQT